MSSLTRRKKEKSWQFQLILSICELLQAGCWQAIMRRAANSKCNGTLRNVEQKRKKKKDRKRAPNEWMNESKNGSKESCRFCCWFCCCWWSFVNDYYYGCCCCLCLCLCNDISQTLDNDKHTQTHRQTHYNNKTHRGQIGSRDEERESAVCPIMYVCSLFFFSLSFGTNQFIISGQ